MAAAGVRTFAGVVMGHVHLILFTLLWTAVWVAPVPRLSRGVELLAGLIPFVAFGLRVFAGFFVGVPADDPVRSAVGPLLEWVTGGSGWIPYAVVLDATVVWLVGPLPAERQAAAESIAALAAGTVAGLVAWFACGFTRSRSRWLFALAIGVAVGAVIGGPRAHEVSCHRNDRPQACGPGRVTIHARRDRRA